ncbi:MAG: serpin family protein [Planctomycetota bacterium]|jgi:serpin B
MRRVQLSVALVSVAIHAAGAACRNAGSQPSSAAPPDRRQDSHAERDGLVRGNTQFALDLYAKLRSQAPGNIFCAPQCISTALAMSYAGARAETAEQMAATLHFDLEPARLHPAFSALARSMQPAGEGEGPNVELAVANRLWGQKGERFFDAYLDVIRASYGGGFEAVDFQADGEGARRIINAWTEQQTGYRITDILQPDDLSAATVLVLTNAIYFRGTWRVRFDPRQTRDGGFRVAADRAVSVPMMRVTDGFRMYDSDLLQVLELPYDGDRLSMVVVLPKSRDGLPSVEDALTYDNLSTWLDRLWLREVDVTLPRFTATSRFELNDELSELGMPIAFTSGADFSGINGQRDLFISKVIHQAFVDVNEEGTVSAAATPVIKQRGGSDRPATFVADHPFVLLIRDRVTGSVLFLGRIVDPAPESA